MKTTSLSILIVLTLLAAPVLRAQRPPGRHRTRRNLKAKRITNRAQITVATHRLGPTCTSLIWARNQSSAQTTTLYKEKAPPSY